MTCLVNYSFKLDENRSQPFSLCSDPCVQGRVGDLCTGYQPF